MERQGLETLGKLADVLRVVERLDVLSGTCDRYAVQQLEKVEVQGAQNCVGRALFGWQL